MKSNIFINYITPKDTNLDNLYPINFKFLFINFERNIYICFIMFNKIFVTQKSS